MDLYDKDIRIEALQEWVDSGQSEELPVAMVKYIEQLELIRSLYQKYNTREYIIKYLVKVYSNISRHRANQLFNDSLNFFYSNNDIKKEAWRNIYADKFDLAAAVCWQKDDMEGYRRNNESAMKARGLDVPEPQKLPDEFYDRRVIVYQMDARKVGIERVNRYELATFIDNLDVSEQEKVKLQQDAGMITIDLFETPNAEDQSQQ
ncbi:MAG: hypothetical protein NTU44_04635 [Bacteroidetes bacterium]|nr:hypothetical protein [Bacteroidota bacterium]